MKQQLFGASQRMLLNHYNAAIIRSSSSTFRCRYGNAGPKTTTIIPSLTTIRSLSSSSLWSSKFSSNNSNNSNSTRINAIQRFFEILEQKYGGNLPMQNNNDENVIVVERYLTTDHLQQLMSHNVVAIHVKEFYNRAAASEIAQQLLKESNDIHANTITNWKTSTSNSYNRGLESSDVTSIGEHVPYNIASSLGLQDDYFVGVQNELRKRRSKYTTAATTNDSNANSSVTQQQPVIEPQLWPLDLLRLQLDENWPGGAGLACHSTKQPKQQKQVFGGGLSRIMYGPTRWSKGYIHVDEMAPLNVNNGLFSANIYLQLPENNATTGNNDNETTADCTIQQQPIPQDILQIWPLNIRSRWDWYRNATLLSGLSVQDAMSQTMLRLKLGDPITLSVRPGDLLLFCVQRPHAAIGFQNGTRISLQCFIQHNGMKERLLIDC